MKRLIATFLLATSVYTTASPEALSPQIDCKEIFRRCANDCREIFDMDVLKDACTVGCFLGYMQCE